MAPEKLGPERPPVRRAVLLLPGGFALLAGLDAALLALTLALASFDVARRTMRGTGLTRYIAVCLLAGYGWLLIPAVSWLAAGQVRSGAGYDAVVHAVTLGIVLSMSMAHAPVILPAVLVGDARGVGWAVTVGGALNIVAVLAFLVVAGYSAVRAQHRLSQEVPG